MGISEKNSEQRSQAEDDASHAWLLATNCLLYEADPGPAQLNIGSDTEPAWVSRSDAWRDAYAHQLLEYTAGDHARLLAAAEACRARLTETYTTGHAEQVFRRRLAVPGPRRRRLKDALGAYSPRQREDFRQSHRRAIDLCELAAQLVVDAGADVDDTARRRLLAGTRHTNMMIGLGGVIPGVAEQSTDQLNSELDAIDREGPTLT